MLVNIFGTSNNETHSKPISEEDKEAYDDGDSISFSVVFKEETRHNHEKYLIVILQGQYGWQHGHELGKTGIYFFSVDSLQLVDSIIYDIHPIGETADFSLTKIGHKKTALLWTFESTGNQHYEKNITFYLVEPGALTYLFTVESGYSDVAWNTPEDPEEPCSAYSSEESYSIRTSDAEWYDVVIEKIEYDYEKGCVGRVVMERFRKKLIYVEDGYIEEE